MLQSNTTQQLVGITTVVHVDTVLYFLQLCQAGVMKSRGKLQSYLNQEWHFQSQLVLKCTSGWWQWPLLPFYTWQQLQLRGSMGRARMNSSHNHTGAGCAFALPFAFSFGSVTTISLRVFALPFAFSFGSVTTISLRVFPFCWSVW